MSRTILNTCPEVLHYTGIWTDTLRGGATQLINTNKLLRRYEGITGLIEDCPVQDLIFAGFILLCFHINNDLHFPRSIAKRFVFWLSQFAPLRYPVALLVTHSQVYFAVTL